jgi:hypothetical protein
MYFFYFEDFGFGWVRVQFANPTTDASALRWPMACNESVWAIPGTLDPTED